MAIYMYLPYATGSVTSAQYPDWIKIDSFSFGIDRNTAMETGDLTARASGVARFSQFQIRKELEESTPPILSELVRGTSGQDVEIAMVKGDGPVEIVRYLLKDAIVSSYEVVGDVGAPNEVLRFTYSELEVAVTPRNTANKKSGAIRFNHSLKS